MEQISKKPKAAWWLPSLLFPIGWLICRSSQIDPNWTEQIYSQGLYPHVMEFITALTGPMPFTLVEWILLFGSIGLTLWVIFTIVKAVFNRDQATYLLLRLAAGLCGIFAGLYFLFVITAGVNYHRLPFASFSGLEVRDSSVDELYDLCAELIERTNATRSLVQEDERGVFQLRQQNMSDLAEEAHSTFLALGETYPILSETYVAPKPVFFSEVMSYCQFLGSFSSYTGEACINVAAPDYNIPEAMCHEQAHMRGFMREDEANFIAYLACSQSENLDFQYSALAQALIYSMNALYSADSDRYAILHAQYSEGVVRDFTDDARYWREHDTFVAKAADQWNDTYLKANHQTDGVKSYGRMVDLLLAEYRARHGNN